MSQCRYYVYVDLVPKGSIWFRLSLWLFSCCAGFEVQGAGSICEAWGIWAWLWDVSCKGERLVFDRLQSNVETYRVACHKL